MVQHHKIFDDFHRSPATSESAFDINFVGSKVRHNFECRIPHRGIFASGRALNHDSVDSSLPDPQSEDYLEWIDLLESISLAGESFVMVEAGAGYGRWLVNAANAVRRLKNSKIEKIHLVGIEPDPTRFSYLKQHFADNEIATEAHDLIQAGLSDKEGFLFHSQARHPAWSYGDPLVRSNQLDELAEKHAGPVELREPDGFVSARSVPCLKLSSILKKLPGKVDLLDCDLQGEESRVLSECISSMNEKVRRLHVGTHGKDIEDSIRKMMQENGWKCLNDYTYEQKSQTPFGEVSFVDGIQTWVNPRV